MTLCHVITERCLLCAVDSISKVFIETVSDAAFRLTDISLLRGTFVTRDLIHYIFSGTPATKSTVAGATGTVAGAAWWRLESGMNQSLAKRIFIFPCGGDIEVG